VRTILLAVNPPEARGFVFALYSHTDDIGRGVAPAAIATLASRVGREGALRLAASCWLVCGAFLLNVRRYVTKDVDDVKAHVQENTGEEIILT